MKVCLQKKGGEFGREWNTGAVKNSQGMIGTILLSGQRSIAKVNPWNLYAANWDLV